MRLDWTGSGTASDGLIEVRKEEKRKEKRNATEMWLYTGSR